MTGVALREESVDRNMEDQKGDVCDISRSPRGERG